MGDQNDIAARDAFRLGIQYTDAISQYEVAHDKAVNALEKLSESQSLRNVLMGLPMSAEDAASLQAVLSLYGVLRPAEPISWLNHLDTSETSMEINLARAMRKRKKCDTNRARDEAAATRKAAAHNVFGDGAVGRRCREMYPSTSLHGLFSKTAFLVGVLGENTIESGDVGLDMKKIFGRLNVIESNINNGWDMRLLMDLARSWLPTNTDKLLMDMEQQWQQHFACIIAKQGYLDVQAAVTFPGCEERLPSTTGVANAHMIHMAQKQEPLGAMIDWTRGCFSPQFINYFNQDVIPTIGFAEDPTSPQGRLVRCESPYASRQSPPLFFQLGSPPRACVFKAVETNKFGDKVLAICNYVESLRHQFFLEQIHQRYGKLTAQKHLPPKKEYDLLFLSASRGKSFSWHSDAKFMLSDADFDGGVWQEKYMRVMTLFLSKEPDDRSLQLKYRQRGGKHGEIVSYDLGSNGIHEQGFSTQSQLEHSIHCSPSAQNRRFVWTARASRPLQETGLRKLLLRQAYVPRYSDYNTLISPGGTVLPVTSPESMKTSEEGTLNTTGITDCMLGSGKPLDGHESPDDDNTTTPPDLRNEIAYRKRVVVGKERALPLQSSERKLVQVGDSITNLLSTPEAYTVLLKKKIRLRISDKSASVPMSPFPDLDTMKHFATVGQFFRSEHVRDYFCLPKSNQARPPWGTNASLLTSIHLTKRYKSPLEDRVGMTLSPVAEMHRILNFQEREGFVMYLSGGNSVNDSSVGPTVDKPVITSPWGESSTLRTSSGMTIGGNQRNPAIFEAAMTERVVAVFFSEQLLPRDVQKSKDGKALALYAGVYKLNPIKVENKCSAEEVKRRIQGADQFIRDTHDLQDIMDPIEVENLNFLRAPHLSCRLSPVWKEPEPSDSLSSWKEVTVDARSKERFCFSVHREFTSQDLAVSDLIPTTEQLVEGYFGIDEEQGNKGDMDGESGNGCEEEDRNEPSNLLVCDARVTKYGASEIVEVMKQLIVACNMRLLRLNVDDEGFISTLHDFPSPPGSENSTKNTSYGDILGDGTFPICGSLGPNVTKHPYPCPIPSGDAKVVYLQKCNIGSHETLEMARKARGGATFLQDHPDEFTGLLVQSFIAETTGNPACNALWSEGYKNTHHPMELGSPCQLPSNIEMVADYVMFMKSCAKTRHGYLTDFLQHHFKLPINLCHIDSYGPILSRICVEAPLFTNKLRDRKEKNRVEIVSELCNFLCECVGTNDCSFLASKIIANMEEMIDGHPFGPVSEVTFGTGASYGAQLVDWEAVIATCEENDLVPKGSYDPSLGLDSAAMANLLLAYVKHTVRDLNDDWYGYFYYDEEGDVVRNRINGRELNVVDIEHILCKLYIFREHEPGGGRSMSRNPRVQKPHCFPSKTIDSTWVGGIAEKVIKRYCADYLQTGIQYIAFSEEWAQACATLSVEHCMQLQDRTSKVFTNEYAAEDSGGLPMKHRYNTRTFVKRTAWKEKAVEGRIYRMKKLENGPSPSLSEVHFYEDVPLLTEFLKKAVHIRNAYKWHSLDFDFTDTFTLHSQHKDCVDFLSVYDYHVDKPFAAGRVLLAPLQGVWYCLVASPDDGPILKDDSRDDFETWKTSLPCKDRERVDKYVSNFQEYARRYHQQERLNIYKMFPGKILSLETTKLVHGSIIPRQRGGKPRMVLLCHALELY